MTEQSATDAMSALNNHFGIPVSEDAITRNVVVAIHDGDFYYIKADDSFVTVLGETTEFEITDPITELPS